MYTYIYIYFLHCLFLTCDATTVAAALRVLVRRLVSSCFLARLIFHHACQRVQIQLRLVRQRPFLIN